MPRSIFSHGPLLILDKPAPSTSRPHFLPLLEHADSGGHLTTSEYPTPQRTRRYDCSVSPIEKLPAEMTQRIATFLKPSSAACLALTSKSLLRILGIPHLHTQIGYIMPFLVSLQRDLPHDQWLECYHCRILHRFTLRPSKAKTWTLRPESQCSLASGIAFLLPSFGIRFRYVQMALKLHRKGLPDTENVLLKSLAQTRHSPKHKPSFAQTSVRIAENHLLIKLEYKIFLHHEESAERVLSMKPQVCPHWSWKVGDGGAPHESLSHSIRYQMRLREEKHIPDHVSLKNCDHCETEFTVAYLDCEWTPRGKAIYINAWKDYGACLSPFDITWRSHVPTSNHRRYRLKFSDLVVGDIRQSFEQAVSLSNGKDGLTTIPPTKSDDVYQKLARSVEHDSVSPACPPVITSNSEAMGDDIKDRGFAIDLGEELDRDQV